MYISTLAGELGLLLPEDQIVLRPWEMLAVLPGEHDSVLPSLGTLVGGLGQPESCGKLAMFNAYAIKPTFHNPAFNVFDPLPRILIPSLAYQPGNYYHHMRIVKALPFPTVEISLREGGQI